MKQALALGLIGLTLLCTGAPAEDAAPDPDAVKLARTILIDTHVDQNMALAIDAATPLMVEQLKHDKTDLPPAVLTKFIDTFRADMKSGIPEVLTQEAKVYARHYSLAELQSIVNFYESDVGKKLVAENPKILDETGPLAEVWGRANGERAMQNALEKLRAAGVKI